MKIFCKSQPINIPASQQVKRIGKYLYDHLETAYKFKSSPNTYDIYFILYYQTIHPRLGIATSKMQEMHIDINVTTYQNKIRVDVIEITPEARTLGFDVFSPEKLQDLQFAKEIIFEKVCKRVSRAYEDLEFLF